MLRKIIEAYPTEDKRRKFLEDVEGFVNEFEDDDEIFATHGHCTDGFIAAVMLRYAIPHAKILPLDYWFLNEPKAKPLRELPFKGIVDLAPFNVATVEFWVDHHLSAVGKKVNAKRIRFDCDGDSGSYQLLLSGFLGEFPDHIVELVALTRITDTASYTILPPYEPENHLDELLQFPYAYVDDLNKVNKQIQRKAYLLDDAVSTAFDFWDWQQLVNKFASKGFEAIKEILPKINEKRAERRIAYDIAQKLPVSDFVAFIVPDEKYDVFALRRYLQARGPKAIGSITESHNGFRISLRRAKGLSAEENSQIQLHLLAERLKGGGHAAASGGFSEDLETALKEMKAWASEAGLKFEFVDLR